MRGLLRFGMLGALSALWACGNVSDNQPDAMMPDTPAPPPPTIERWIVSTQIVPKTTMEARALGLDLNGDGVVDNQFGAVLATLYGQGLDIQASVDTAIARGTILMLGEAALGGADPTAATYTMYTGANPQPAPCTTPTDTTCRHHLDGTGTFAVAATSAHDPPLTGTIANGTLVAGPGHLQVTLLVGITPVVLDLLGARVRLQAVTPASLGQSVLAGAITQDQRDARIYPALQDGIKAAVAADCTATGTPPGCGCAAGSLGATYLNLFDTSPKDCLVTLDEIRNNTLIKSLLAPDVTVEGQSALSVGFGVTAVKAAFTP
jgi:hypothetical protein